MSDGTLELPVEKSIKVQIKDVGEIAEKVIGFLGMPYENFFVNARSYIQEQDKELSSAIASSNSAMALMPQVEELAELKKTYEFIVKKRVLNMTVTVTSLEKSNELRKAAMDGKIGSDEREIEFAKSLAELIDNYLKDRGVVE